MDQGVSRAYIRTYIRTVDQCVTREKLSLTLELLFKSVPDIPYTAKLSSGKTFAVGIENECSRENFRSSSFFYKNVYC